MTAQELKMFRAALKHLPFYGISLKDFAEQIHLRPHTLYNYICGQRPSYKHYQYILYVLERDYPAAVAESREMINQGGKIFNEL